MKIITIILSVIAFLFLIPVIIINSKFEEMQALNVDYNMNVHDLYYNVVPTLQGVFWIFSFLAIVAFVKFLQINHQDIEADEKKESMTKIDIEVDKIKSDFNLEIINRIDNITEGLNVKYLSNRSLTEFSKPRLEFLSKFTNVCQHVVRKSSLNKILQGSKTQIADYTKQIISKRIAVWPNLGILDSTISIVHRSTLLETDKILLEQGMNDYGVVSIRRSSNNNIQKGTYFYIIDKDMNFILMPQPFKKVKDIIIFDANKYKFAINNKITFSNSEIRDFQLFGTELMKNSVQTDKSLNDASYKPGIANTMILELVFGQSYTILKGMSKVMQSINDVSISTFHEIEDTRYIQLIFTDNTDLELQGIAIFKDFNRKMGNVKNKTNITKKDKPIKSSKEVILPSNDILQSLSKLNELLQMRLITQDDYDSKKAEILNRI